MTGTHDDAQIDGLDRLQQLALRRPTTVYLEVLRTALFRVRPTPARTIAARSFVNSSRVSRASDSRLRELFIGLSYQRATSSRIEGSVNA